MLYLTIFNLVNALLHIYIPLELQEVHQRALGTPLQAQLRMVFQKLILPDSLSLFHQRGVLFEERLVRSGEAAVLERLDIILDSVALCPHMLIRVIDV